MNAVCLAISLRFEFAIKLEAYRAYAAFVFDFI